LKATRNEPARGKDPDWTTGTLAGLKDGQLFIFDVAHFRVTPKQTQDRIRRTAELDGSRVVVWMEKEGGASGKIASNHYVCDVLKGLNFHSVRSMGDMVTRAGSLSSAVERGNVFVVRGVYINAFLDEAEVFPEAERDDKVDSTSGAYLVLTRQRRRLGLIEFGQQLE